VFYLSDYGTRYLDAADFAFEHAAFASALRFYRTASLTDDTTDLVGEILASYKLIGLAPDEDADVLRERIAARQNPDGSWGSQRDDRYHRTFTALLGLMDWRRRPRGRFGGY